MQDVGCIFQVAAGIYPMTLYCEGVTGRQRERLRKGGLVGLVFGFRVGKGSALGIVPDLPPFINSLWFSLSSPSISSSSLLVPAARSQLPLCWEKIWANRHFVFAPLLTISSVPMPQQPPPQHTHLPKPCHFQSQHTTKCRADSLPLWVVLFPIFSPTQPPHHLRRKEKTFVQKTKKKGANRTCKRQRHFFYVA